MDARALAAAVAPYRGVPGIDSGLSVLLAGSSIDVVDPAMLLGGHLVATEEYLAVYLVTRTHFGLLEASRSGAVFTLVVPIDRVRRVAVLETVRSAQLIFEVDADQTSTSGVLDQDGIVQATTKHAGWEVAAVTAAERASAYQCVAAYVQALSKR